MDDIRYSELRFLLALKNGSIDLFSSQNQDQLKCVGLPSNTYVEMAINLLEELCVRFDKDELQLVVARLRGELSSHVSSPQGLYHWLWDNPRQGLYDILNRQSLETLRITYRGLRRIEELRDVLRQDRILEHFGVLLDIRYFRADLEEALQRNSEVPVSVIYADMDNFKSINTQFGHEAGDVVMKAYLEAVRDTVGVLGTGYRGVGDETVVLMVGQGHEFATQIAEKMRKAIACFQREYRGKILPRVTASIGLATCPPEPRSMQIENLADERQGAAKKHGKDRVVAAAIR